MMVNEDEGNCGGSVSSENAVDELSQKGARRRMILKAAVTAGAVAAVGGFPAIVSARGEQPVLFGVDEPLTGTYAITGRNEVDGIRIAVDEINAKGGILGRPCKVIVQDSTSGDAGVAVQVAQKFIHRDKVNFLLGNVNSGLTMAMSNVAHQAGVFMVDPGGHADPITGKNCHWDVYQVDPTTSLLVNGIYPDLLKHFGKKFYFLVPDYAFGLSLLNAYKENIKKTGAQNLGAALIPLGTSDYSSYLIKAQAAKPDTIVILQNGEDQVNALKQTVQFGLDKRFHIAGANIELETLEALPATSRIGTWVIEWYFLQPGVPHVKEWVASYRKKFNRTPTARSWFGHTAGWACALAAEKAKSLDPLKMARALNGYTLPPEVTLGKYPATFRADQHALIGNLWFGHAKQHGSKEEPDDLFEVVDTINEKDIARTVAETGCHMTWPS